MTQPPGELETHLLDEALRRGYVTHDVLRRARNELGSGADSVALFRYVVARCLAPEDREALRLLYSSGRLPVSQPDATVAAPPSRLAGGQASEAKLERIGGYELEVELARGGMGAVYRARHPGLQQEVAVKVLLSGAHASERQRERFLLEARATARLRHPGIVAVHDVGDEGGVLYLAMELIDGESLADRIEREGALEPRAAAALIREAAEALHYAHDQLILHRDVKPDNLLIDREGRTRVTDFGLAKQLEEGETSEDGAPPATRGKTRTGEFLGTPAYAAPEQIAGGRVDARTDVYGLGATLYEALTGAPPFAGGSLIEVMARVVKEDPAPPRSLADVPAGLELVCLTCLEKDPEQRYPTARALAEDLLRFLDGAPLEAQPPTLGRVVRKWARRNPTSARVGVALAAATALFSGAGGWLVNLERSAARGREEAAAREARQTLVDAARRDAERALAARGGSGVEADTATARALDALQAAERWRALAPDDPDAARALFEAASTLGEVALGSEQWALAARGFEIAAGVGVDDAAARRRVAQVEEARAAARTRRQEVVTGWLDRVASGELGDVQNGLVDAMFGIVRYPEPDVVQLLVERLTPLSERLEGGQRMDAAEADLARVVCQVLGRIGIRDRAVEAVTRHLLAEQDPLRAVFPAVALVRLEGEDALEVIHQQRRRFGRGSSFDATLRRKLKALGLTVAVGEAGDDPMALLERGERRQFEGDEQGALQDYGAALELNPQMRPAWIARAQLRLKLGQLQGALDDANRALELAPNAVNAWIARGDIHERAGRRREALSDYARAVRIAPRYAQAWASLGKALADRGRTDRARAAFDKAIEIEPGRAFHWTNRAAVRQRVGDLAGALSDAMRAVELEPGDANSWNTVGVLRKQRGDLGGAVEAYGRAIDANPDVSNTWTNRAIARHWLGDLKGALADHDQAVARASSPADVYAAHYNRGAARLALEDFEGARADFDRSIQACPDRADAWCNRGLVRAQTGDYAGAERDYGQALELNPTLAAALLNRAAARESQRKFDLAAADFDAAAALVPPPIAAFAMRGLFRIKVGRLADARDDLRTYLRMAPKGPDAAAVRRALADVEAQLGGG